MNHSSESLHCFRRRLFALYSDWIALHLVTHIVIIINRAISSIINAQICRSFGFIKRTRWHELCSLRVVQIKKNNSKRISIGIIRKRAAYVRWNLYLRNFLMIFVPQNLFLRECASAPHKSSSRCQAIELH